MSEKITVPTLGESVTEATVSKWLKSQGDKVTADEPIVELETDKVNVEVPAPQWSIRKYCCPGRTNSKCWVSSRNHK